MCNPDKDRIKNKYQTIMIRISFFLFFMQLLLATNHAQTTPGSLPEAGLAGSEWRLPPLEALIDSALAYSPLMRLADKDILLSKYALTDVRKDWMKKINLSADTRYGSMFDYSRISSDSKGSFIPPSANMYMLNFGVGMSMYMPISDIFDRKRLVSSANIKVEQAEIQKEEVEQSVKLLIISMYYEVLSLQKTLEIQLEMRSSAGMLYEQTKSNFEENRTDFAEYTKAYETYLSSQSAYETQKNSLLRAIRALEVNVGISLLK